METVKTTSEEMRNVVLSEGTKMFLVAHRAIGEIITKLTEYTDYNLGEGVDEALWDKADELQKEILNLMKLCIQESLSWLEVKEI